MEHRIVIDVKDGLVEGEILQVSGGKVRSINIHELLPDLENAKSMVVAHTLAIAVLKEKVADLEAKVKELRGEDQ